MAMDIGDAKLTIKAEDKTQTAFSSVNKSTGKMTANFKKAGLAMTAIGAGLVLALGKMVNSYSKAGDEVAKMAKRTGFGTEALSELRHAAKLSGASLAGIEKGSRTLSGAITDAGFGLATYVRAFESIGLAYEDLARLSPEEQFIKVMEALAGVEDATLRAAIAADLMGRSGTAMLPMLAEGTEGLAKMRQEAHDLNVVFDADAAAAAEAFEDSKTQLQTSLKGLMATIAEEMMPHIQTFIDGMKDTITKITDWTKEHPALTDAIAKLGLALTALAVVGGPMFLVASYIPKMIAGFVLLKSSIMTTLIPALVKATLAFIALLATMGPWGWALLIGGIAAAGVALAGLAALGLISGGAPKTRPATPAEEAAAGGKLPPVRMQYGGIVPGPIGKPIPIIAHGGEPFGGVGGRLGNTIINVNVEGSIVSEQELVDVLRREFILEKDRNTTTGF